MKLFKTPEFSIDELYENAFRFYSNGCYKDAEQLFRLLTTQDPLNVHFWMGLAGALQMQKKYAEAADTYGAAALLEESETDPFPHARAAECLHALNEGQRAMQALKSALMIAEKEAKYDDLIQELKLLEERWTYANTTN